MAVVEACCHQRASVWRQRPSVCGWRRSVSASLTAQHELVELLTYPLSLSSCQCRCAGGVGQKSPSTGSEDRHRKNPGRGLRTLPCSGRPNALPTAWPPAQPLGQRQ